MILPEKIIIPPETAINGNNTEDDEDPLYTTEPIVAYPIGEIIDSGLPVKIPTLDPERIYYIHQSEVENSQKA
jgi:hypothetical protein